MDGFPPRRWSDWIGLFCPPDALVCAGRPHRRIRVEARRPSPLTGMDDRDSMLDRTTNRFRRDNDACRG